jgi:hypothetical protein
VSSGTSSKCPESSSSERRSPALLKSKSVTILNCTMCNEVSNLAGKVNPEALNTSLYRPYYAQDFHGRVSASGVRFGMNSMMAAHPSYRVRNGGSCDKSEKPPLRSGSNPGPRALVGISCRRGDHRFESSSRRASVYPGRSHARSARRDALGDEVREKLKVESKEKVPIIARLYGRCSRLAHRPV